MIKNNAFFLLLSISLFACDKPQEEAEVMQVVKQDEHKSPTLSLGEQQKKIDSYILEQKKKGKNIDPIDVMYKTGVKNITVSANGAISASLPLPVSVMQMSPDASGTSSFYLEPEALHVKKLQAMNGDIKAAISVSNHYEHTMSPRDNPKQSEIALYWLTIAAENGGTANSFYNLAFSLVNQGGEVNCSRAIYWLKKIKHRFPKYKSSLPDELLKQISNKNHKCWITYK